MKEYSSWQIQLRHPNGQGFSIDPSLTGAHLQRGYDASVGVEGGFDSISLVGGGYLSQYFGEHAYQAFFKARRKSTGPGGTVFDQ